MFKPRFSRREDGKYDAAYGKGSRKLEGILTHHESGVWFVEFGFLAGKVIPKKKLGEVKGAWGTAAEAAYAGGPATEDTATAETSAPPPPPSLRPGPPSLSKCPSASPPSHIVVVPQIPKLKLGPQASGGLGDDTHGEGFAERFTAPDLAEPDVATCPSCGMPFQGWSKQEAPSGFERFVPPCRCDMHKNPNYEADLLDFRMWKRNPETGKVDVPTVIHSQDAVFAWMSRNPEYVMTDGKLDEPWASVQRTLYETTGYAEYRPGVLGDQP